MFGGYFLNIHDTSGSETDVNFQRMCQKFILQKERQVFIKCILRNVHNSYVFVHIGRRYCGRETVTPSIDDKVFIDLVRGLFSHCLNFCSIHTSLCWDLQLSIM